MCCYALRKLCNRRRNINDILLGLSWQCLLFALCFRGRVTCVLVLQNQHQASGTCSSLKVWFPVRCREMFTYQPFLRSYFLEQKDSISGKSCRKRAVLTHHSPPPAGALNVLLGSCQCQVLIRFSLLVPSLAWPMYS